MIETSAAAGTISVVYYVRTPSEAHLFNFFFFRHLLRVSVKIIMSVQATSLPSAVLNGFLFGRMRAPYGDRFTTAATCTARFPGAYLMIFCDYFIIEVV